VEPQSDAITKLWDDFKATGSMEDRNRLVVHYIEPHYPYYAAAASEGRDTIEGWEQFPFGPLKSGEVSFERVWETYLAELRAGLDSIETLLENYDAERAVITADHGEAFGEWFGYGHRSGTVHPNVRRVPWVETDAVDTGTCKVTGESVQAGTGRAGKLSALGYI